MSDGEDGPLWVSISTWVSPAEPGAVHVIPAFGKRHKESDECWCAPKADPVSLDREKYAQTVWVHEAPQ